jgi:hypothetical protein
MTETVFAGKNIEKFSLEQGAAAFAFFLANIAPFAENFFLRNRPGNRGDDHRENY